MRTAVRYSHDRLTYTGRIAAESFTAWAASGSGRSVLEPVASRMRFALFGRLRAARRCVWRQVVETACTGEVIVAVQREIDAYLGRVEALAYARDLPRVSIDFHRFVVVPRWFASVEVARRIDSALNALQVFAELDRGELLRLWLARTLVDAIEAAVKGARPSPQRPLPAGHDWIIVGVNEQFEWGIPLEGRGWPGHYYALELTRTPVTRAIRRAAGEAIGRLEMSLPLLSRVQRREILSQVGSSLEQLLARVERPAGHQPPAPFRRVS
jgi:hypothetical protein